MTVDQFTQYLRNGLSRYYVEPDVTVNIVQLGGIRVHVFGEVKNPAPMNSPRAIPSWMP